jgi:hypothetical protein
MRMRMVRAVAMAVLLPVAACSVLTSTAGLSGGPTDEAGVATETGGESTSEAGGDVSSAGDSGDAGEAGPVDPCVGATMCDRFERDQPQGDWASLYEDNGGSLKLDLSTYTSAVKSLAMHVPPANLPHAQLSSINFPNVAHVLVAFAMKTGAPDRQMSLMRLQLESLSFDLFMLGDHFVADENGPPPGAYFDYTIQSGFKAGVWQRWTMELDAKVAPAVGIVTIDGVERLRKPLKNAFARGSFNVLMGSFYAPDGPARDVSFDDVSITILP